MSEYIHHSSEKNEGQSNEISANMPKKFVFHINPENVPFIEALSYQKKHDLINQLLYEYRQNVYDEIKSNQNFKLLKNTFITIISIIIGIPLLLLLVNFSLDMTKASYLDMQRKFEQLYK